jgi:glycosyltransferase involved in cell wall biosynthesis
MLESKENNSLISVVIPAYNYGQYIGEAIESLLSQTEKNWECIVVDDGSTDNTNEVVNAFCRLDNRINYIKKINAGLSAARNTGLEQAQGVYIQFLDADDRLEPLKLEQQKRILENNADVDIVYSEVIYFDENDSLFPDRNGGNIVWSPNISGDKSVMLAPLLQSNILELGTALFRKTIVEKVGIFNPKCSAVADWEFCVRCAILNAQFHFEASPDTRIQMRHHMSMSKNGIKMTKDSIISRIEIKKLLDQKELIDLNEIRLNCDIERLGIHQIKIGIYVIGFLNIFKSGYRRKNLKICLSGFKYLFNKKYTKIRNYEN